jgi:hypothetical protein
MKHMYLFAQKPNASTSSFVPQLYYEEKMQKMELYKSNRIFP